MSNRLAQSLVAAILVACATSVAAQWTWRDDSGGLVFSDKPPPANVKPSQIVRQPSAEPVRPSAPIYVTDEKPAPGKADTAGKSQKATPAAANAPKSLAEQEMEARKREQERVAAEKKASEEQARKQQLAQDCERSRSYARALEDGLRVARTDAQGNPVVLDDAGRADELARVRARVASSCN